MNRRLTRLAALALVLGGLLLGGSSPANPATAQTPSSDLAVIRNEPGSESPVGQTPIDFPLIFMLLVGGGGTSVVVTNNLPAEMTFGGAEQVTGPPFTITSPPVGSGGTVTFSAASTPGDAAVFRIWGRIVPATPIGTVITNTATIAGAGVDPNPANNTRSGSTIVRSALGAPATFLFTTSTTQSQLVTPITRNATAADGTRTRVTAVFNGATVFDQSVDAAQNSPSELALEEAARAALRNAAGPQAVISGPVNLGTTRQAANTTTGPVNELSGRATTTTNGHVFGPTTILTGPENSQLVFVPPGTANFHLHVDTVTFLNAVTTLTSGFVNVTHLQFTATLPLQPIPQAVQNPAAVAIVSAIGGGPSGSRNPTPVPSRPAVASPAVQTLPSMPTLRPPSTGDAGLVLVD